MTDIVVYDFLEHHGIRGMRWGVRKSTSNSSEESKPGWSNRKKAVVILGSAAAAGAILAGGLYAKKHFGVPVNKVTDSASGKKLTEALAKEPINIVHSSRGKKVGFQFLNRGGLDDPLKEFESAGLHTSIGERDGYFKRYGKNLEKVAATFNDPDGRKDFAGRIIPHQVMLPESLAKGVSSNEDAKNVAWPLIKDTFEALYHK